MGYVTAALRGGMEAFAVSLVVAVPTVDPVAITIRFELLEPYGLPY